jgi:hypothetical protein
VARYGSLEIPDAEVRALSREAIVERLVEGGMSRLTAERAIEIEREAGEPGRARRRSLARR